MNNTPDYNNNLAFAPGDWSDSRVVGNTDRTVSTIQLIEKIEELEKENAQLRQLLKKARDILYDYKDYFQSGDVVKAMDILDGINAAIGESEE